MNRVLGDYMETMLYKVFVSVDEHTTVAEVWLLKIFCLHTWPQLYKIRLSEEVKTFAYRKFTYFHIHTTIYSHSTWITFIVIFFIEYSLQRKCPMNLALLVRPSVRSFATQDLRIGPTVYSDFLHEVR